MDKKITAWTLRQKLREYIDNVANTGESLIFSVDGTDYILKNSLTSEESTMFIIEHSYSNFRQQMKRCLEYAKAGGYILKITSRGCDDVFVVAADQTLVYIDRIEKLEAENERLRKQIERLKKYKELIEKED